MFDSECLICGFDFLSKVHTNVLTYQFNAIEQAISFIDVLMP